MWLGRRITVSRRRGFGRVVFLMGAAGVAILALLAGGCGASGKSAATDDEKAADVEVLNEALAQELTAVAVYERGLPLLRGQRLAIAREFRGQGQAHVDALTKAIRGLGGETDAEPSEPEEPGPRSGTDALALAYETENLGLALTLDAAPRLETAAPRTLAAALTSSHAQHIAVLRQALGADLAAAVPEPFEPGDIPPPGAPPDEAG
jgi:ferritin-like protein